MRTYQIDHSDQLVPGAVLPRGHVGVPLCMGCDAPVRGGYCPNCEEHVTSRAVDAIDQTVMARDYASSLQCWREANAAVRSACEAAK